MLKKCFYFILLLLLIVGVYNFKLIVYGAQQLKGQLQIVWNAVPVEHVLTAAETPDSIRKKLILIQQIRKFAVDSLGLKDSKNYTTYYDQKGKPAIWVITASEPFALKAYEWKFPFLGRVSYKGFFEKELGEPEVHRLRMQGYDVEYSPTGGWSTLGFFRDPILSRMLRRNEGQLAELIIHELTHSTIYVSGKVEFNENLATFVGEEGAVHFLRSFYGDNSDQLRNYLNELKDEQLFGTYMITACRELQFFYANLPVNLSTQEKQLAKYRRIAKLVQGIDQLPLVNMNRYHFNLPKDKLPDNTFFMGYQRYRGSQSVFKKVFEESGKDIRIMLKNMKNNTQ